MSFADGPSARVKVTDTHGALVHARWTPTSSGSLLGNIDRGSELPAGVYLLTVSAKEHQDTQRMVNYQPGKRTTTNSPAAEGYVVVQAPGDAAGYHIRDGLPSCVVARADLTARNRAMK